MRDFINAALPWLTLSTAVAVFLSYYDAASNKKSEAENIKKEDTSEK